MNKKIFFSKPRNLTTTDNLISLGILAGAIVGATLAAAFQAYPSWGYLFMYFIALLFGIVIFGSIPWKIMHDKGIRNWVHACILGFALSFIWTIIAGMWQADFEIARAL